MADLNLTDEQIQELMSLGAIPGKEQILQQQMRNASLLRNSPMPQGRDSGRVYTHANPLEALGNVAEKALGAYQMRNINSQQQALIGQQTSGRKRYFDILRQQLANQQQQIPAVTSAPNFDDAMGH